MIAAARRSGRPGPTEASLARDDGDGLPSTRARGSTAEGRTMAASPSPEYPADLAVVYQEAVVELAAVRRERAVLARRLEAGHELRPWQVELLKLQRHLEAEDLRMIVLFEGRD